MNWRFMSRDRWQSACLALAVSMIGCQKQTDAPQANVADVNLGLKAAPAAPPREETAHERAVKEAVKRGEAYLKKRILQGNLPSRSLDNPAWHDTSAGIAALMGLAMLEAGTPPEDPAVETALKAVRDKGPKMYTTYVLGCALLFLNRLDEARTLDEKDRNLVRSLALRVIAGQTGTTVNNIKGMWSYHCMPISAAEEKKLLTTLDEGKYEPTGTVHDYGSNSMSQFAMLGLWGARRFDVPVRAPLLQAALQFHSTQFDDGSWVYNKVRSPVTPDSNTCAGLLGLAMEQALREDREFSNDPTVLPPPNPKFDDMRKKGFARLGKVIGRKGGQLVGALSHGDIYFLWCVERVAVIYGLDEIEGKDWYQWGSELLLKAQKADGTWNEHYDPAIDTSFAILFLKRANLAKDLTDKLLELRRNRGAMLLPSSRHRAA